MKTNNSSPEDISDAYYRLHSRLYSPATPTVSWIHLASWTRQLPELADKDAVSERKFLSDSESYGRLHPNGAREPHIVAPRHS
jgi:hypothetical protein